MPSRSPRRRHAPSVPSSSRSAQRRSPAGPVPGRRRLVLAPLRRAGHARLPLRRSSSDPGIRTPRAASDADGQNDDGDDDGGPGAVHVFPRYHTCLDVCRPGLPLSRSPQAPTEGCGGGDRNRDGKVLVSVTVEGSPGPVRAMVRLGASVEEAIGTVVDAYGREGRSPRLDPAAMASFQLHHSHFCLQSLNKADTVGQVGGRSFYLRRNRSGGREGGAVGGGHEVSSGTSRPHAVTSPSADRFLCIVAGALSRIGRRVLKLWRALGCAPCG